MKVLFIAAHPDDCEVSCLGTWLRHKELDDTIYYFVAADCEGVSPGVTKESEEVMSILLPSKVFRMSLPNTKLPTIENRAKIREILEVIRDKVGIDTVYMPWLSDINQDHQAVAEETVRVFRYSTILQYCVQHSCPNFLYDYYQVLCEGHVMKKKEIMGIFKSQIKRGSIWFIQNYVDSVAAMMKARGLECGYDWAEGFKVWRVIDAD